MRGTKIVCTMGPATENAKMIESLILSGMNVARLNLSHGTHDNHKEMFNNIRTISDKLNKNIAIMFDLQGPKIRTGFLENHQSIELVRGEYITITARPTIGNSKVISTDYSQLPEEVKVGNRILLADGTLELRVVEIQPPDIKCEIIRGGILGERKGMNLPEIPIKLPSMTEKDWNDLDFGISLGADYIALSFVRSPEDVIQIKKRLKEKNSLAKVISKIERPEALRCIDEIIGVSDGLLIARGDLAVETTLEEVPLVQKRLIHKCNLAGIPVITATQMLESMTEQPIPTRAEITDVANAVLDGTDAVMLSAETATGKNPIPSVEVMAKIIQCIEKDQKYFDCPFDEMCKFPSLRKEEEKSQCKIEDSALALGKAVKQLVMALNIKAIACFTYSGYSAMAISNSRPKVPIYALTPNEYVAKQCSLYWGVQAIKLPEVQSIEDMLLTVENTLIENSLVKRGDIVVIVAGYPLAVACPTNLIKVHVI
ncbi:MAG TPA: pyruvate kinase [Candidatus Hydrogenedens sp.]|nr:pyruvate kinase [Candidatus Hydrogenedens sp.]